MTEPKDKLIVALDVDTFEEARILVDSLGSVVNIFKVGSQLFTACGPVVVRYILVRGKKVFLDLKFHDIPNTVANAIRAAVNLSVAVHEIIESSGKKNEINDGIFMCTVHTMGGKEMLERAVEAAAQQAQSVGVIKPLLVGITVLTSEASTNNMSALVLERARLAKECGLSGVVASSHEAKLIRQELGDDFIIVTPGIRPSGAGENDQKRVMTPREAARMGSDFLVVGRPIVKAENPVLATKKILEEISQVN